MLGRNVLQSHANLAATVVTAHDSRKGHPPRVMDLLPLDVFRDAAVRGGEAGLGRVISAVTVGEVPDHERFLRGGELLLTSLFAYRDSPPQDLKEFVEAVDDHGASAVAFKPGRFVVDLPIDALEMADQRGLPLIALPADVIWSDVIREVSGLLLSRAGAELATILRVQAELAQGLVGGDGVSDMVNLISTWLCGPAQVLDHNFEVIAATKDAERVDRARLSEQLKGYSAGSRGGDLLVRAGSRTGIARVLMGKERELGYLIVWGRTSLDNGEALVANQAALFCSIDLAKRETIESARLTHRGDLLADLLSGQIRSAAEFRQRLRDLGQRMSPAYAVVIIAPPVSASIKPMTMQLSSSARRELAHIVSAPATVRDGRLVILWPIPLTANRELPSLVKSFLSQCKQLAGWHDSRAAIGRVVTNALEARISYQDAVRGCEVLASEKATEIVTAERFALEGLLAPLPKEELRRFLTTVLGSLLKADRRSEALLRTLTIYLATDRSWKATSARLGIHRNTLTNRLKQIERLIDVDLHNSTHLANLQVALQIANNP